MGTSHMEKAKGNMHSSFIRMFGTIEPPVTTPICSLRVALCMKESLRYGPQAAFEFLCEIDVIASIEFT